MIINLRPATRNDAPFVALVMAEAIGDDIMERCLEKVAADDLSISGDWILSLSQKDQGRIAMLIGLAERSDTLYSFERTVIATDENGHYLGGLIAYPAEGYIERRKLTFELARSYMFFDPSTMEPETVDGEYYLDSVAVLPTHRGKGIARALLLHGIAEGTKLGLLPVLACSPENPLAHHLYTSLGFEDDGRLFIFGEDYIRMSYKQE